MSGGLQAVFDMKEYNTNEEELHKIFGCEVRHYYCY
jgi:hypothetical protein